MFESLNGKQPIFADGVEVGYVTSARIGFSVGRGVVIGICERSAAGVTKKSAWKGVLPCALPGKQHSSVNMFKFEHLSCDDEVSPR